MDSIKELRNEKGLTQSQVSDLTGIPLRTYINYENDRRKAGSIKYDYIVERLNMYGFVDETHGILSLDDIVSACSRIFADYDVRCGILFGSYATGTATETSDVDLLVVTEVSGIRFYGMAERLREKLKKKVDLLNAGQLTDNVELTNEILTKGRRIYVQE